MRYAFFGKVWGPSKSSPSAYGSNFLRPNKLFKADNLKLLLYHKTSNMCGWYLFPLHSFFNPRKKIDRREFSTYPTWFHPISFDEVHMFDAKKYTFWMAQPFFTEGTPALEQIAQILTLIQKQLQAVPGQPALNGDLTTKK